MQKPRLELSDRTGAEDAVAFIVDRLDGYDLGLLDWVRLYPMTEQQHQHALDGECRPLTLSTCWQPRVAATSGELQPENMYRIKVNVWQGPDYPAEESKWGRIPPRPIRRRSIPDRYTTRGICRWSYPDRLAATVHALARGPLMLGEADRRQTCSSSFNRVSRTCLGLALGFFCLAWPINDPIACFLPLR